MSPTLRQKTEHEKPAGDEHDPETDDKTHGQRELFIFLLLRHEMTASSVTIPRGGVGAENEV